MHWSGFGAEKSDRLAMKWLGRAVQQGCTKSQFFINKILAKAALLRRGRVEVKAVLDALVGAVAAVEEALRVVARSGSRSSRTLRRYASRRRAYPSSRLVARYGGY